MAFQKGNKLATGGPREGSGRTPSWLRQECQKHAPDLLEFLASVANGKDVEQAVGSEGEVIRVPASVRDRVKATEILLDRAFGKADQAIQVTNIDGDDRPTTEALLQTVAILRAELDGARKGTEVAAGQ